MNKQYINVDREESCITRAQSAADGKKTLALFLALSAPVQKKLDGLEQVVIKSGPRVF